MVAVEPLSLKTYARLPADVAQPSFTPGTLRTGIVHLGLGAFHRAHQAVYTQRAIEAAGGDWGICGVSLRRPDVRDQLAPQDGLYTLAVKRADSVQLALQAVISEVLVAPEDPGKVVARLADAGVSVVTLTITEKGYCLDPATGELRRDDVDVAHDLQNPGAPRTALGFLAAGLDRRRQQGLPGLTVMSCDNLAGNGKKLREAVLAFCREQDPDLAWWVASAATFPCSMVDRIVPATTAEDRRQLQLTAGLDDRAPVVTEPFSQWVVERKFAGPVPAWDQVGVDYVDDVRPFEVMKLRLLNGSHSCLAYMACLCGIDTVADAVERTEISDLVAALMAAEMVPTLALPDSYDLAMYQSQLLARFANRGLRHLTRQIAMDGSQKIPQRLLPPMRERLASGLPVRLLAFAIATWVRFTRGVDEAGRRYELDDPLAGLMASCHARAGADPADYLREMLTLGEVFGEDEGLYEQLLPPLQLICDRGVLAAAREWLSGS